MAAVSKDFGKRQEGAGAFFDAEKEGQRLGLHSRELILTYEPNRREWERGSGPGVARAIGRSYDVAAMSPPRKRECIQNRGTMEYGQ